MPPTISATDQPLEKLTADAVVVAVGKGPDALLPTPGAEAVDRLLGGRLFGALADLGARGAEGEVTRLPSFGQGPFPVITVTGLGAPDSSGGYTPEAVRRAAGAASRALRGRRSVVTLLAAVGGTPDADRLHAVGEGSLLGAYEFTAYKSDLPADRPAPPQDFTVVVPGAAAAETALRRVRAVADAVALVRDLVNTPPNDLYPAELAARGAAAGEKLGLAAEILDEEALAAGGYGGILAVGSGSARKPRLLRLTYSGPDPRKKVALVGKGITFDTGGINLKTQGGIEEMKYDMCGAASVLGTFVAAVGMQLPINLVAIAAAVENMPDGNSYRPSDVITSMSGKTIEVGNTDAEGRLILCDALTYAQRFEPQALLDVATLTGACVVALGKFATGVMSKHDDLAAELIAAGETTFDRGWQLPLWDEYQSLLNSNFADVYNIGGRWAGAITAGCFLSRFTEGQRWAHLDIAGVANGDGKMGMATGRPVGMLAQWLMDRAGGAA